VVKNEIAIKLRQDEQCSITTAFHRQSYRSYPAVQKQRCGRVVSDSLSLHVLFVPVLAQQVNSVAHISRQMFAGKVASFGNMAAAASKKKVNVLIVGSGPAGLTAAIYTGRAGLAPLVAAGGVQGNIIPGGQLMITSEVENYPGFPEGIQGPELMDKLFAQSIRFGAEIVHDFATEFEFVAGGPHGVKVGSEWYSADAVILANGAAAKWLNNPGEAKFVNRGISACATCDGPLPIFRNQVIYVVGGGDSACEEALFLTRFAKKVVLVHRRDSLRASKIMAKRVIENSKIEVSWNTNIVGYLGDTALEGLILEDVISKERRDVECKGLFMAIGHEPNTKSLRGTGIDLDEVGYIKVQDLVHTNIEGVFAAGDCHDKFYRQAITASGFGCMAAISCERWLESRHSE